MVSQPQLRDIFFTKKPENSFVQNVFCCGFPKPKTPWLPPKRRHLCLLLLPALHCVLIILFILSYMLLQRLLCGCFASESSFLRSQLCHWQGFNPKQEIIISAIPMSNSSHILRGIRQSTNGISIEFEARSLYKSKKFTWETQFLS